MSLISTAPKDMSLLRRTAEGYAHNMEERKHRLGNEDRRFEREKKTNDLQKSVRNVRKLWRRLIPNHASSS